MVRMSNAERQKKYREKKKLTQGPEYRKKETARVKKYYIPTTELSARKLAQRRERIRRCMKKCRDFRQREHTVIAETFNDTEDGPCDSTVNDQSVNANYNEAGPSHFQVKMNFATSSARKRKANRKLTTANKKVKLLDGKVAGLERRNSNLRKKVQRLKDANENMKKEKEQASDSHNDDNNPDLTPKSKSRTQIQGLHMTPSSKRKILKKLEFQNCLVAEVQTSLNKVKAKQGQRPLLRVLCGKIIHKYQMQRQMSRYIGVNTKQIRKARKGSREKKVRQQEKRRNLQAMVTAFMERDDVSTCLPGKKDSKKVGKVQMQKRVLNDYLYNLHLKFKAENTSCNISLSVFSRLRPVHIQLVQFQNRKTCLCQRHQNMSLKCKLLKDKKVSSTDNPDLLVEKVNDPDILDQIEGISEDKVTFSEWQRVSVEKKERVFKRMCIVQVEESREKFVDIMRKELAEFRQHIQRVRTQFKQTRILKESLPHDHAICHMDFAENYVCGFAEEVQSAYFDKSTVTLHPVVIYTRDKMTNEIEHKSLAIVSDETSHTASTVFAFMKAVVEEVRTIIPNCSMIHYMTDSPTSQYRNKQIFSIIAQHGKIFTGIQAAWLYFEAGHGKGACDGVGGTAKRLADMAVRRRKAEIQSAQDFFKWGKSQEQGSLKYLFVDKSACLEAQTELAEITIRPVKGTLQLHAVVSVDNGDIATRETSCYCPECFRDGKFIIGCPGWNIPRLVPEKRKLLTATGSDLQIDGANVNPSVQCAEPLSTTDDSGNTLFSENTFVAAVYAKQWFMGKILEYDRSDGEYFISFMVAGKNSYKWPAKADTVWIREEDVICAVRDPVKVGKTRNVYKFDAVDIENVLNLYE